MVVERLDFAKRQGGEPQTVRLVRQGEPTPYFGEGSRYFRDAGELGGNKGLIV